MRTILFAAILSLLVVSCKNDAPKINADSTMEEVAKEMTGMKSYVIQYKSVMNMQGMKNTSIITEWIDVKNDRMAVETETSVDMMGVKTNDKTLMIDKDGWNYVVNFTTKTGFKSKSEDADDNPMDMIKSEDDVTFRQMVEKEGSKVLNNETFLGKDCIVIESLNDGMSTKIWYYKGIPLKISNKYYTMEATKFEENVSIPDSKFEVPEGIKFAEMPSIPDMK